MQIKDKHIGRILWAIIIVVLIIAGILASCGIADKLEASHYHFYYHTKALIVVEKKGNKLYCRSAAGAKYYRVYDPAGMFEANDTIDLRHSQNSWVYSNTKFIKKIPDNECSHSKKSPRRQALQHRGPVPLHE